MTRNERLVSVGKRLRRLGDGPLRGVAPLVHRSVTLAELRVLSRLDSRGRELPTPQESERLTDRVTMVVKTFERPDVVRRLVRTARPVFPGRIIVADDSRKPSTDLGPGVEVVPLSFNVGLSAGRNAALARVTTEFVFVTDDDIVFTAATDIVAMMEYLDEHPEVDVIAPQLVNLPWLYTNDRSDSPLFKGALEPRRPFGEVIDGGVVVPKVANVFLARATPLRDIGWDERLRLVEHRDFFSRASGHLVCVQADGVRAYHVRAPYDANYMEYRLDLSDSMAHLAEKWSERGTPGSSIPAE